MWPHNAPEIEHFKRPCKLNIAYIISMVETHALYRQWISNIRFLVGLPPRQYAHYLTFELPENQVSVTHIRVNVPFKRGYALYHIPPVMSVHNIQSIIHTCAICTQYPRPLVSGALCTRVETIPCLLQIVSHDRIVIRRAQYYVDGFYARTKSGYWRFGEWSFMWP